MALIGLDARAYAALASTTQLSTLRCLEIRGCGVGPAGGDDGVPPQLAQDGGLQLLAEAPWITGLTELKLRGLDTPGQM